MPTSKPTSEEMPPAEMVLAAIERAHRHRRRQDSEGVLFATVKDHLGLSRAGWTTTRLRPTWEALQAARLIQESHRGGSTLWSLTSAGRKRLEAARQAGTLAPLPESPQHRCWRETRAAAEASIGGFQRDLRAALTEATCLLDAGDQADSDSWWALGEQLGRACQRVGAAIHCLGEWPEPDDSQADVAPPGCVERRTMWGLRRS